MGRSATEKKNLGLDERRPYVRQILTRFAVYLQIPEENPDIKFHTNPSKGSRPLIYADRWTERNVEAKRCFSLLMRTGLKANTSRNVRWIEGPSD